MAILVIVCLGLAFVAGVTESARIIKELHIVSGELHARIAALEAEVKNIKFPLSLGAKPDRWASAGSNHP